MVKCPYTEISVVINNNNNMEVPQNRIMTGEKQSSF
jgi:hypothetical protein